MIVDSTQSIKVLIIKLTSMGDVLHLMPALTELQAVYPQAQVDWVVEDSFSEIPSWHPLVNKVITVSTRRWRSLSRQNRQQALAFRRTLKAETYDVVLDAQGLIKSAVIARMACLTKGGRRVGFCAASIKESPAAWLYQQRITVDRKQHAIERLRQLFAQAFNYSLDKKELDYSITQGIKPSTDNQPGQLPYIVLLHGTTWPTKHIPDVYWRELSTLAIEAGYKVKLAWGNEIERTRACWVVSQLSAQVLPKLSLSQLASELKYAAGVISVDTGLGHLTAALGVSSVSIYGATDAKLTGAIGKRQRHIQTDYACSPCLKKQCDKLSKQVAQMPCYQTLSMSDVWQQLADLMRG